MSTPDEFMSSAASEAASDRCEHDQLKGRCMRAGCPDGFGTASALPEEYTASADGARVLDELYNAMREYVVFPSDAAAVAVTLWIAATHTQRHSFHAPRLAVVAPKKRCGKSRLLDVVYEASHKPLLTVNATVAAVFRSIDEHDPPTLLVDEADSIFGTKKTAENNEDFRGLLNAGHQRGRPATRCSGPNHEVKQFPTFAMAALAGIGDLPDTIMDRAVVIRMRRRHHGEEVKPFRARRDAPRFNEIRDSLAVWLGAADIADTYPDMLPLEDRAADTWEPLFLVADLAGGWWPDAARKAAGELEKAREEAEDGAENAILTDCRDAFAKASNPNEMKTETLLQYLKQDPHSQWATYGRDGLNAHQLGKLLAPYEIRPKQIRFSDHTRQRGYLRPQFEDAWNRYCPSPQEE
ncbi:DUF3631 domain-containing protein [Streptomyces sp. YIM S03343]